jgi:hypothetical protein
MTLDRPALDSRCDSVAVNNRGGQEPAWNI